ncbi:helix-turn-helix domain-containing protein [uncultured Mucilaginibacter sp.]|uniref:helix-turn-helix domain-containing protein n=1 Tax=uncultured Mucilaginibacter sp. TaxID=797541 RepID=UPI0025DEABA9|nr:helix-turn-helix domain-containing protein [uncultured Mucilaginibacter sp.]
MQNIILSPISLENFELLIKKSVTAALALAQTTTQETEDPKQFTIAELAVYLKCTKATIHAYKKRGVFKYYQTGRTIYFKKSDVEKALEVGIRKGLKD